MSAREGENQAGRIDASVDKGRREMVMGIAGIHRIAEQGRQPIARTNWLTLFLSFPLGIVITDPNDSRFDLEAYLTMKMADEAK